ncbi:MAG: DASH family cryptochrome [Marinilabilia sp.]
MSNSPVIYWFRNDLRLHDNPALLKAIETGHPVIPVFIIDDHWYTTNTPLGFPRTGHLRKTFLAQSLQELKRNLTNRGQKLYIFRGQTVDVLSQLYHALKADAIFAQREFAHEEILTEKQLAEKTNLQLTWGSMLYPPDQVDFPTEKAPYYFTKFKNKVAGQPLNPGPVTMISDKIPAPEHPKIPHELLTFNPVEWDLSSFPHNFKGGENEGINALNQYIESGGPLHYAETRDLFRGANASSKLGPWLANGSLSPGVVFSKLEQCQIEHPEKAENIRPLMEQLIWRDYFRFLFLRYGKKLFTTKGLRKTEHGMYNDEEAFFQWQTGRTGQPLIDALMRELRKTGFMSNRGRMLTSFYLSKEMKVNWQWGAAWFESSLLDYDVCSNYGNWAYQSGRGTDSRVNRRFNLKKQAEKFDPDGDYIRKWLE